MSWLAIKRVLILLSLAAMPALADAASSWARGTVWVRQGESRRPLAKAYIGVRDLRGALLAFTRTSDDGTYELASLPRQRVRLTAEKPGYYTRRAAERSGGRVILDCTLGCVQGEIDFELVRGGVVAGDVVDRQGEPIERVRISVRPNEAGVEGQRGAVASAVTDDCGRFRLAGLRPASYILTAQGRAPGSPAETTTLRFEVSESEVIDELTITLGDQTAYSLSGRLDSLAHREGKPAKVRLQAAGSGRQNYTDTVGPEGRFHFPAVQAGRYLAWALVSARGVRGRQHFLDIVDIHGHIEGLVLRPGSTGDVEGVARPAAGAPPRRVRLEFHSNDGFGTRFVSVDPVDGRFQIDGLVPGSYNLRARSSNAYVQAVHRGNKPVNAANITVSEGLNSFEVLIASDHGEVFGTVRDPVTRARLPHARVALAGDRGEHLVQADQTGRFVFETVIPGEYRICAWADITPEEVANEAAWEAAGCSNNIIPIDPESEVEINLSAAP